MKQAIVIGAGFAGLSAAATLALRGVAVNVLEKNDQVGGRAACFSDAGFVFDKGPSWYWMPEVAAKFFEKFGKSTKDYFELRRLDPSYQMIFTEGETMQLPADYDSLRQLFEQEEAGAGLQLDYFLQEAKYKYETALGGFVQKPCVSIWEFADPKILKASLKFDLLNSFAKHARKYFKSKKLLQIIEFPVLFLGARPNQIPSLYSMMNYADMKLGTWYPMGGFAKLPQAMQQIAEEKGVQFFFNEEVKEVKIDAGSIQTLHTQSGRSFKADLVINTADYHHMDQQLLQPPFQNYSKRYWEKRVLAPGCLLYYIGVGKRLPRLLHHNLFFDGDFDRHATQIYDQPAWPDNPLSYVCVPSKSDPSVAPAGKENLFLLIPVAPALQDDANIRDHYLQQMIKKLEHFCGTPFKNDIEVVHQVGPQHFVQQYHAFKGNAYGLANTLSQTAIFKPSIQSTKLSNLFHAGQLTVPGPGVPPSIISGELVAEYALKKFYSL